MIVGDKEYKWLIKGICKDIPEGGVILYHSEKLGLTININDATQFDTIGDAIKKTIYRNDKSTNGFIFKIERIELNNDKE